MVSYKVDATIHWRDREKGTGRFGLHLNWVCLIPTAKQGKIIEIILSAPLIQWRLITFLLRCQFQYLSACAECLVGTFHMDASRRPPLTQTFWCGGPLLHFVHSSKSIQNRPWGRAKQRMPPLSAHARTAKALLGLPRRLSLSGAASSLVIQDGRQAFIGGRIRPLK